MTATSQIKSEKERVGAEEEEDREKRGEEKNLGT